MYNQTSDRTKMAYYVIYSILRSDVEGQIKTIDDLRDFLNLGLEQCDAIVENQSKIEQTKSWYKKAISLTYSHSKTELEKILKKKAIEYGFTN
ncbi:MAG: hypothetical protein E7359_03190 [Clostridiales bacterium]|nr:hypothetical protein [Clostridiales bacterium]